MLNLKDVPEGIIFKILVQPKSSRNDVVGLHNDALKIKLTAPPVDGAANKMCIKFMAKVLNVAKSNLEIVAGHSSRTKHLKVTFDSNSTGDQEKQRITDLLTAY